MEKNHRKKVENVWDDVWVDNREEAESTEKSSGSIFRRIVGKFKKLEQKWNLNKWIFEVLMKEFPKEGNLLILEAGSGEGTTAMTIYEKRFKFVLLDISKNALNNVRKNDQGKYNMELVRGSFFQLPFKPDCYDVVLSIGILEHFLQDDRVKIYDEMFKTCRKGGLIITLTPYKKAIFYRMGRWYAKKINVWRFGFDEPLDNIYSLIKNKDEISGYKEYSGGFFIQLYYLMYFFYRFKPLKMFCLGIVSLINRLFWSLNHIPFWGFWVVNVTRKK